MRAATSFRSSVWCDRFKTMSVGKAVPKVVLVTQIRSGIDRPYWEKRTLKALGLGTKLHKCTVHKCTPSVIGMLASVRELIKVNPIVIRGDLENSPNGGNFLLDNGQVFVDPEVVLQRENEGMESNNVPAQ